ncbi:acyl carrier protein [bacterium]|nr:acyl carrier protein [bacterium]
MDQKEALQIIRELIAEITSDEVIVADGISLVGENAILDSMQLVELCLALEDIADERNFEFDWTSPVAMSKSKGMFRNVLSLSAEFSQQSAN